MNTNRLASNFETKKNYSTHSNSFDATFFMFFLIFYIILYYLLNAHTEPHTLMCHLFAFRGKYILNAEASLFAQCTLLLSIIYFPHNMRW